MRKANPQSRVSDQILRRVYLTFGAFVLFGLAILLRVLILQWNRTDWEQERQKDHVSFRKMEAARGAILAADGSLMAVSLPFYKIALDPTILDTASIPAFRDSLYQLSLRFTETFDPEDQRDTLRIYQAVSRALQERDRHLYLTRQKINFKQLEEALRWPLLNLGRYKGGVIIEKFNNERYYPMGDLARVTLGRIVNDTVAIRGIEYSFDRELKGRDAYFLAQRVVGDNWVPVEEFGEEFVQDGYDVQTTLDVNLQDVVERALKEGVEKNQAKFGTAVLLDVQSGAVKAVANYPEGYNYAYALQIEPGSTFKAVSAAAMLEDGVIGLCDTLDTGNGRIKYDDKEVSDTGPALGKTDFEKIFAYSSNVGVSKAVHENYRLNPECYFDQLRNFGFFDVVNSQLEGEPKPQMILPGDEAWNIATLPSLSYGYSIRVTPLQMATFYNGIANKGKLLRPWVVQEIRDNARVVQRFGPELINPQMCSEMTAAQVTELLKAVTRYGTGAVAMRGLPFEVAGKTGTARKVVEGVGYVKEYRASFGGFFPADNPRYTLYIMIDEPSAGYSSGGAVAAPIFRQIAAEVYRLDEELALPPSSGRPSAPPAPKGMLAQHAQQIYPALGVPTSSLPGSAWVRTERNVHQVNLGAWEPEAEVVPNVQGMSARDALVLLERMGMKVSLRGSGKVRKQSLRPGVRFRPGVPITLFLS
jgi:cell division protein FtsI (penicillin-binding protein 3)